MHNLKYIRENSKVFKKKITDRNVEFSLNDLLELDKKNRGFSFKLDGPLDMRMSCEGPPAQKFLDEVEENTLANIIFELGDKNFDILEFKF